jgi:hypothetical protein
MKVTINWRRAVATALLAAGIWVPSAVKAANIPLADPSFEDYTISTGLPVLNQYAYAPAYRPTSGWIDDQDGADGEVQDDAESNWLYTTDYANYPGGPYRATPRTGNQAMHGFFHYSGQTTAGVFEAGKSYVFSVYAQGDSDTQIVNGSSNSRVWMYMFDGSQAFSEPNSLTFKRFSPTDDVNTGPSDFPNRDPLWDQAQSQAAWQQISLRWTVQPGAPEIGKPIGVAVYVGRDGAVDDASLIALRPGDFDGDDDVDGADFVVWQTSFPSASGKQWFHGDADGDGDVDGADFVVWQTNFPSAAGPATVPEPASVVLIVGAAASLAGVRRLRSRQRE